MRTGLERTGAAIRGGFRFVGRQRELDRLSAALREPPAVVLIEGEAGIGKSRLVRETLDAATDLRVLTGFCHPLREPFPFGPVVDALRKAGHWLPPVDRLPPSTGALVQLLPDLADALPPAPPRPADARSRRHQLVEAIRSFLEALGPAVLVVEDLHWVDQATRELLLLLARDLPGRLSLVLTYRAEDLPGDAPLLGTAYRRPSGTGGTTIQLGPLAEPEVRELAQAALGVRAGPTLGAVLYRRSEGLPLIAEEDLITLGEHSSLGAHGAVTGTGDPLADLERQLAGAQVPRSLREAVAERLAMLSPAGAAIVEAACVLAVPATEPLLARVAGLDPEQGSAGLTESLRAALLREVGAGRYAFRHVLAQQAAYQRVPGPRRTRLHQQAIDALQAQSPPALVQIAHHTLALGDHAGWLRQAEAALGQTIEVGDEGTAATLLHQILAQPRLDPELRSRAALALARIAYNGADYTANAAMLRRIIADPQLPVATRGDVRMTLGILMVNLVDDPAGFQELETAVGELTDLPERAARAMAALAIYEQNGAFEHAWSWIARAEEAIRDCPTEAVHATVYATRLTLLARDGNPEVWPLLDRLPRHSADPEVVRQLTRALYNTGDIAIELGHDRRAAELLTESRDLAQRAGHPQLECYGRTALLRLAGLAGHWADVEQQFAALTAEFPDIGFTAAEQAMMEARLAAARGLHARALELLDVAAAYGERTSQVTSTCRVAAEIAAIRLAQGEPSAAWASTAPAVAALRQAGAWARATGLVPVAVETALATGDRTGAERLAEDAENGLQGRDAPGAFAELHTTRGMLLGALGSAEDAVEEFALAGQRWQRIGRPYESARAAERLGGALGRAHPEAAVERLSEAIDGYDRLGAVGDSARCRRTLRDLGLTRPTPRGRRGYGDQLSPRERQVAELLARGATNQVIAQALVLSPRTVEQHVAHVLKKLGTSRKSVREALLDLR